MIRRGGDTGNGGGTKMGDTGSGGIEGERGTSIGTGEGVAGIDIEVDADIGGGADVDADVDVEATADVDAEVDAAAGGRGPCLRGAAAFLPFATVDAGASAAFPCTGSGSPQRARQS